MVDLILFVTLLLAAVDGLRRGFIVHAGDSASLALSAWVAFQYYGPLADRLVMEYNVSPVKARLLAAAVLYAVVQVVSIVLLHGVYRRVPERFARSWTNRLLGTVPSLAKVGVFCGIVLTVLGAVPVPALHKAVSASRLSPPLLTTGRAAERFLGLAVKRAIERAFAHHPMEPAEGTRVAIPKVTQAWELRVRPDLENRMLIMLNQERRQRGLPSLREDPRLREMARAYSMEMWNQGFFGHVNPQRRDVVDRARTRGIRFHFIGENIALAPDLRTAEDGLMHSPGHRANILDVHYHRVGIGIVLAGSNGLMVTQEFRD